ncbi:hypothetical protein BC830DRAFT_1233262 [Chytriomyces sp. MP71]|nr:hypothetical protein BC830DRAFT_1233262 [Chytriomyces sp. MP71]
MFTLTLLASMNVIRGSEEYSPQDVITAIGSFLTCVEMAIACVMNCFVFGWREFVVDDDAAVRRLSAAAAGVYVGEPVGAGSPGVTSGVAAWRWRQSGRLGFLDALVDAAKPDDLFDDGRLILGALLAWAGFKENSSALLSDALSEGYDDEDYRRERRSLLVGRSVNATPASIVT